MLGSKIGMEVDMKPGERSELAESERSERCQLSGLIKPLRAIKE